MLSGITNFFFGGVDEDTACDDEVRLRVTHVDDEWALVDRSNCAFSCITKDGECPCNSTDRLGGNLLDTNSDSRPRADHVDDTWIVDPPSCFTGTRSQSPQTSPMENLLLEHPSTSVYVQRGRPNSTGLESDSESPPRPHAVVRPTPRRPRAVTARAGLLPKTQLTKAMQQAKRRVSTKTLNRHHLERHNKTYNFRARDRRQVRVQQPRKSQS